MKKHEPLSSAKAIVGFLSLAIVFVIFYKFYHNQDYFFEDINALRSYVAFAIIGAGFLIGLLYLSSQTTHNSAVKSPKSLKKKKK